MLATEFPGRNPGFCFAENTDDLFVEKSLLLGGVLMWRMKTLLISRYINQRGSWSAHIYYNTLITNPGEPAAGLLKPCAPLKTT